MKEISKNGLRPEITIGMAGHIAHGKTVLTHALTGVWTLSHSEELKRGITIKLGYANFVIYEKDGKLNTKEGKPLRKISILDVPGHETLMAIMLTGAALIDGALLVIAANEPCPRPQTREHLIALQIAGIKNIVVVQNKIDLVSKERALENYREIKEFLKGTIAENAPIIPISAQYGANIDLLLEAIQKYIPTPKRDLTKDPIFLIARSFDVNKPGTPIDQLKGGVLGGAVKQGKFKIGDEIEIRPGRRVKEKGKESWEPIFSEIASLVHGDLRVDEVIPGGNAAIGTKLDPLLTKGDALVGQVVGKPGKLPPVWHHFELEVHLLERVVGTAEELRVEPLKVGEPLLINAWTAKTLGIVKEVKGDLATVDLRIPVCIYEGEKVVISRRVGEKWRLIGYGIVK